MKWRVALLAAIAGLLVLALVGCRMFGQETPASEQTVSQPTEVKPSQPDVSTMVSGGGAQTAVSTKTQVTKSTDVDVAAPSQEEKSQQQRGVGLLNQFAFHIFSGTAGIMGVIAIGALLMTTTIIAGLAAKRRTAELGLVAGSIKKHPTAALLREVESQMTATGLGASFDQFLKRRQLKAGKKVKARAKARKKSSTKKKK